MKMDDIKNQIKNSYNMTRYGSRCKKLNISKDFFVDRKQLMTHLINNYPEYLGDLFDKDMISTKTNLSYLSNKVLTPEENEWFTKNVTNYIPNNLYDLQSGRTL